MFKTIKSINGSLKPLLTNLSVLLFCYFFSTTLLASKKNEEPQIKPHIVGGSQVVPGSRSYQAMLVFNGQQGCGGTLIADYWVITAAHCLDNANTNNLTIRLGAHYINGGGSTHRVTQIIKHPQWGWGGVTNGKDIGLIRLATPAPTNLKRAKLPTPAIQNELAAPGRYLTVSGWGRTFNGGPASNVLLEVDLPVLSTQQCRQQLGASIDNTVICGGGPNNTSACNGDSGGPFVAEKNGTFYSMGTVSWGRNCRGATAFTRTLSYVNWIRNYVNIDDGGDDGDDGDDGNGGSVPPINSVLSNINVRQGTWTRYVLDLPAGYTQLEFSISGGNGEVDMYINYGRPSNFNDYDCRPYQWGNYESCDFSRPRAGRWFIDLYGYYNSRGLTLTTRAR